jgi:hypothetical protein
MFKHSLLYWVDTLDKQYDLVQPVCDAILAGLWAQVCASVRLHCVRSDRSVDALRQVKKVLAEAITVMLEFKNTTTKQ